MALRDEIVTVVHTLPASTPVAGVAEPLQRWHQAYLTARRTTWRGNPPGWQQHRDWFVAIAHEGGGWTILAGNALWSHLAAAEKRAGPTIADLAVGEVPGLETPSPQVEIDTLEQQARTAAQSAPHRAVAVTENGQLVGVYTSTDRFYSSGLPGRTFGAVTGLFSDVGAAPQRTCPACAQHFSYLERHRNAAGRVQWVCPHCRAPYPEDQP